MFLVFRLGHTRWRCLVVMSRQLQRLTVISYCRNSNTDNKWLSTCSVQRKENILSAMPSLSVILLLIYYLFILLCSVVLLTYACTYMAWRSFIETVDMQKLSIWFILLNRGITEHHVMVPTFHTLHSTITRSVGAATLRMWRSCEIFWRNTSTASDSSTVMNWTLIGT